MGKINNELAELIKTAIKERETIALQSYRNIKAKFLEFKTSPDGIKKLVNGEMTDADEINTINKMIKERNKDIETYGSRQDLIVEAKAEIAILNTFVPKAASESEIQAAINAWVIDNHNITQKDMGIVIKYVKSKFDNVDGGMVARIVKSYIK